MQEIHTLAVVVNEATTQAARYLVRLTHRALLPQLVHQFAHVITAQDGVPQCRQCVEWRW